MVVARVQSNFPDGLSVGVAPPEQCADGRRMDKDPFRAGAGGYALAYYCHCLCSAQRAGLLELRVYRNRQVHGDLFPWEVVLQYVPWDIPVQYVPHFTAFSLRPLLPSM